MFVSWSSGPFREHFYQKASRLSFERSPGLMRVCLECFHKLGRERWRACWRPPQSLQIPDLKDRVPWRASLRAVDCSLHSPFEITLQTNNPSPVPLEVPVHRLYAQVGGLPHVIQRRSAVLAHSWQLWACGWLYFDSELCIGKVF